MGRPRIDVVPSAYFLAAVLLLIFPVEWLLSWLLAALIHESCHLLAIRLLGGRCQRFRIGAAGAAIEIDPMVPWKETLCALAGPLGGAAAVLLFPLLPMVSVCGIIQTGVNLLPIYPLDGGRIMQCLLVTLLGPDRGEVMARRGEWVLLALLLAGGIWCAAVLRWGLVPLVAAIGLLTRKIPCKRSPMGLQ